VRHPDIAQSEIGRTSVVVATGRNLAPPPVKEMGRQPRTGVPFSFQDLREYIPLKLCTAEWLPPNDLDRRTMAGGP
jgi:hypothetical protein